MPMHAIALGSSLVSSEIDWTDPKRVRRSRAVPFSAVLQVMGDPSISTVTFKPASGNYSYKYKPFSGTRGTMWKINPMKMTQLQYFLSV